MFTEHLPYARHYSRIESKALNKYYYLSICKIDFLSDFKLNGSLMWPVFKMLPGILAFVMEYVPTTLTLT